MLARLTFALAFGLLAASYTQESSLVGKWTVTLKVVKGRTGPTQDGVTIAFEFRQDGGLTVVSKANLPEFKSEMVQVGNWKLLDGTRVRVEFTETHIDGKLRTEKQYAPPPPEVFTFELTGNTLRLVDDRKTGNILQRSAG
jgi:hypothetical protein